MADCRTPFHDRIQQRLVEGFEVVELDQRKQRARLRRQLEIGCNEPRSFIVPSPAHRVIFIEIHVTEDGKVCDTIASG